MADVPHEREIYEKLKGRPFAILGVNGDEEIAKAKQAVDRAKIAWPSFAPDFGSRSRIPSMWNVFSWPTTYVIDNKGIIRHINLRGDQLDQPLADLVAAAEQAKAAERDASRPTGYATVRDKRNVASMELALTPSRPTCRREPRMPLPGPSS